MKRRHTMRIASRALECASSPPRVRPRVGLCCISELSKEPRRSESEYSEALDVVNVKFNSSIRALWSFEPGPLSIRDAAMSFTKYVCHRFAWMNSKSRRAFARNQRSAKTILLEWRAFGAVCCGTHGAIRVKTSFKVVSPWKRADLEPCNYHPTSLQQNDLYRKGIKHNGRELLRGFTYCILVTIC
jgi:hypothetical protein